LLYKNIAIAFICLKYYIQDLNRVMIESMINNTLDQINYIIINKKGTNAKDKDHLFPLLEQFDIPIKRRKDF
jgi:D-tyrosyl-tRNA(Tyr) deacylase